MTDRKRALRLAEFCGIELIKGKFYIHVYGGDYDIRFSPFDEDVQPVWYADIMIGIITRGLAEKGFAEFRMEIIDKRHFSLIEKPGHKGKFFEGDASTSLQALAEAAYEAMGKLKNG